MDNLNDLNLQLSEGLTKINKVRTEIIFKSEVNIDTYTDIEHLLRKGVKYIENARIVILNEFIKQEKEKFKND